MLGWARGVVLTGPIGQSGTWEMALSPDGKAYLAVGNLQHE